MSYSVRLMRQEDVAQVTEIDREAFPNQWPLPDYRRELQNRLAHYIVVYDEEKTVGQAEVKAAPEKGSTGLISRLRWLFGRHHPFNNEASPSSGHYIIGFVGFWIMADEAHIITIAVREAYRRQGLGELLLISVIDLATELKAHTVTLEVRISNAVAHGLYAKYSFTQVGLRRGYYSDNREDALMMSTQDVNSATFQTHFHQLKQAHSRKCRIGSCQIVQ